MTEQALRERVIRRAASLLGLREADGGHRRIVEAYNSLSPLPQGYRLRETDPWCAAFVSALGQMEGMSGVLLPECSCDRMIALYRKRGLWSTRDGGRVRPGDLIFYNWNRDGSVDHVGLVTEVDAGGYDLIEGNSADAVHRGRTAGDSPFIAGFAFPDYAAAADEAGESPPPAGGAERPAGGIPLPTLGRGARGGSVLAMQGVLIARSFGCGPDGADGDFGPCTEAALRRYQQEAGLCADGVCGELTWKTLLGVST